MWRVQPHAGKAAGQPGIGNASTSSAASGDARGSCTENRLGSDEATGGADADAWTWAEPT
ncbi:hypothetical protein ACCO45_005735 [Purpureocillium lilacinum]|uniref:Uncharacterized protein n=1 Tax=Purpureocillium lilacinum TaxID=33203 RepID=A0ACC4DX68_PURLI